MNRLERIHTLLGMLEGDGIAAIERELDNAREREKEALRENDEAMATEARMTIDACETIITLYQEEPVQ